jgi:hypothetical protein
VKVSLADMLACVDRELKLREIVYPKRVESRKMTREDADKEMLRMKAVKATLLRITRLYEGIDT